MIYLEKFVIFTIIFLSAFKGTDAECYVDNCDLNYCSGDGCIKCEDGYFLSDTSCYQCPETCKKCTSHSTCTECEMGYHGATCSSQCKSECLICSSFSQCSKCIQGRYGSYCQNYCPLACIDILCDIGTGRCLLGCRHGYYLSGGSCINCPMTCERCSNSSLCADCIDGYYGLSCQLTCPEGCQGQLCEKESGHCISGCTDGYYFKNGLCLKCPYNCVSCVEEGCTACKTGYWGPSCQNDCPLNCLGCDEEGKCTDYPVCNVNACDRDYCWNNSCIYCAEGYFIDDNSCSKCPEHCTKCTGPTTCAECVGGRFGATCKGICRDSCITCSDFSECDSCVFGRWGSYCQLYCSLGCIDILCDKSSGQCLKGCRHGFYNNGGKCVRCREHCSRCTAADECTVCETGFHGSVCQYECSLSCREQLCDKDQGYCLEGCETGFFLEDGTCKSCPDRCASCTDPATCETCKTGYWGSRCEYDCPISCSRCTKQGTCLFESLCTVDNCDDDFCIDDSCIKCQDGYYLTGQTCLRCPENCITCEGPSTCTQCSPGRYGLVCENICPSTCLDCTSSTYCTSCIRGHHGLSCEQYCPLGCIDIECEKTSGRCIQGCRHGYFLGDGECISCPDTCKRCTDNTHCSQCIDGYFGAYCQHACPVFCKDNVCDKIQGFCLEDCIEGYFSDGDSCMTCPQRCSRCSGPALCDKCKTGYWGEQCQLDCSPECVACTIDGKCLSDPDCDISNCDRKYCIGTSCIKCQDGFYLSGTHCFECPPHCSKCSGPSTCIECSRGRYGSECEYTCNSVCTDCISASQCTSCIAGRHGSFCQFYCPLGCIDILCEKDSGKCSLGCRNGYFLSQDDCIRCAEHCSKCENEKYCTSCMPGYFGSFCQYQCPQSCAEDLCNKQSGFCSAGCKEGYFEQNSTCHRCPVWCSNCLNEGTCTECRAGRWGSQCQYDCPEDCYSCTRQGLCVDGAGDVCNIDHCEKQFCSKTSCIKCEDGYYLSGTHCFQCKEHCTKCTSSTSCSDCVIGRYGLQCEYTCSSLCTDCVSSSLCTSCTTGKYGVTCQSNCPLGCKNILCHKDSGSCVDGCRRGFYVIANNCNQCPEQCAECSDSSHCSQCHPGFYGSSCQLTCPQGCKNQICDKDSGQCSEGCIDGYYYKDYCLKCPITCRTCGNSANCSECKEGYFGPRCQFHCPEGCYKCVAEDQCIDSQGPGCFIQNCDSAYCHKNSCTKCQTGYYLYDTDCYECPPDCEECSSPSLCSKCKTGRYGSKCEYSCGTTCTDCINAAECLSCIPGRYGSTCHLYCPLGCKNILCDKTYGTCSEGCRHGYYLKADNCLQCPEPCIRCLNESHCTECQGGFYGDLCQKICHDGCKDSLCDIRTGNCTSGCAEDYHYHLGYCVEDVMGEECLVPNCEINNCFANTCARCQDGFYLNEMKCYECPENCVTCSSATRCSTCVESRFGSICQSECSEGCKDSVCSITGGFCTEGCKEGYTMTDGVCQKCPDSCESCISLDVCTKCELGFWGPTCNFDCQGCSTVGCGVELNCTTGCRLGYYPQPVPMIRDAYECLKCPEGCSACTDSKTCTSCQAGRWDDLCTNDCSANCMTKICDKHSGHCGDGCKNGYYGSACNDACSSRCETCETSDYCTVCAPGRFGVACEQKCSSHCFRYYCERQNGSCVHGCSAGYFGETCEQASALTLADNNPGNGTNTGLSVGIGILAAVSILVIAFLAVKLFRKRQTTSKEDDSVKVPPVMNQTYDTRIGTADFYAEIRERSRQYENTNTITAEAADRGIFDTRRTISNYPTPSYSGSDKDYYEEAEYSSIKSSIDNIASF